MTDIDDVHLAVGAVAESRPVVRYSAANVAFCGGGVWAVGAAGEKPAGSGDHVDRIQRAGDPLFRDQYPAGVDVGICHLGPALRGGGVSDDVEAELSQSVLWRIVSAGVDPRGGARRRHRDCARPVSRQVALFPVSKP